VDNDLRNSDHFPLILTHTICTNPNQNIPHYIMDKANWNLFRNIAVISNHMVERTCINEAVQLLTNTIIAAADASIPKSSGRRRKQSKPWWNDECRIAHKQQRRAWCIFKRYPTTENFTLFKKFKAAFRCILRRSQRDSWHNYINTISNSTTSKQLWDKIKRASGVHPNN
jgi:hypothetical protein